MPDIVHVFEPTEKGNAALAIPLRFDMIWYSASGSVENYPVTIWTPICPSGYRALGHVAIAAHAEPDFEVFR